MARKPKEPKPETFKCEFCKQELTTEKRLYAHLCEPKRRFQHRDDKVVKLAFMMFQRFCQKKANKTIATLDKFEGSRLYSDFVAFARHTMHINAIDPIGFLDFLLIGNVAMHKWKQDSYYERFVRELSKTEPPLKAMERNIMLMQQWSVETGEHWTEFFRKVAPPQAILWIKSGRLSPWILFSVPESSRTMLKRMSAEQLQIINSLIDPGYWQIKMARNQEDVETMRTMLLEAGV